MSTDREVLSLEYFPEDVSDCWRFLGLNAVRYDNENFTGIQLEKRE